MTGVFMKRFHVQGRSPIGIVGGSILLRKGGPGAASSYSSPEEYHKETGQGLFAQSSSHGRGLEKLSKLNVVQQIGRKLKNIRF